MTIGWFEKKKSAIKKVVYTTLMYHYALGKRNQPALLLLHGWGMNGEDYRELAQFLSSDFYVLVPDLPGFGKTRKPPSGYDVEAYVRRIKKFLEQKKIRQTYVLGHSFGGRIAIKLAHHYPLFIKGLVLSGTPGIEAFDFRRSIKRGLYWSSAKLLKWVVFLPPVRRLKTRFYEYRDFGTLSGVMKETFLKVIREPLADAAKSLQQPTLLLWGAKDQLAPVTDAEKMLKVIPHSYLKIFTKVGHKLPYERPYEVAREVVHFFQT